MRNNGEGFHLKDYLFCRCIFYGLYLWKKHGGRLIIVCQPLPHVMVICKDGLIRHGTNFGTGKWRIEEIEADKFKRWICQS